MSGQNFIVPPKNWASIAEYADRVRTTFKLDDTPYFPIIDVLEKVCDHGLNLFRFEVGSAEEMKGAEGLTCPNGEFIMLREDVYELAIEGDLRARFTAAHELGHLVLHTGAPLARCPIGANVAPYRLSEPQANHFAASLLMPYRFFRAGMTVTEVSTLFGVSAESARNRLINFAKNKGPGLQSKSLVNSEPSDRG